VASPEGGETPNGPDAPNGPAVAVGVGPWQGPPAQVLGDPREDRTRQFLSRIHA